MPPFTTQKTVVLRPMPSPSVSTATMESIGYLTSIRMPERTSVNSWFICPLGMRGWLQLTSATGPTFHRFQVICSREIGVQSPDAGVFAPTIAPWGIMRPIVALVLLSSVAAIGSVLKAQEGAPTAAPPMSAAHAAGSSSGPSSTPTLSAAAGFETLVKPFLAENCYGCHGNKKHKKDLNFE